MRVTFFLSVISLCLSIACSQSGIDYDNIIDQETMVRIMADIQVTETALRQKQSSLKRDTLNIISERAYDSLYAFYKTTPQAFHNSLKYYQQDLENYLQMNEELLTLLTQKADSIKHEGDTATIAADTIQNTESGTSNKETVDKEEGIKKIEKRELEIKRK
jgi:hypothetical protein